MDGDSLTLRWLPPKDDGGAEITNYVVEKQEEGTKTWHRIGTYVVGTSFRVRGLTVGHRYNFRVMAENQFGTSDPATTAEPILAKLPFDPPGAPGVPHAVDTSPDSITISWTKPRNDGGSPITGYLVEKRKVGDTKWSRVTPTTVPDLTYKVPGLTENQQYEFRVCAVNAAGESPWSSASDGIYARPPPAAPKIDSGFAMRDIVVLAGEEFTIRVPYSGNPTPEASWTIVSSGLLN